MVELFLQVQFLCPHLVAETRTVRPSRAAHGTSHTLRPPARTTGCPYCNAAPPASAGASSSAHQAGMCRDRQLNTIVHLINVCTTSVQTLQNA